MNEDSLDHYYTKNDDWIPTIKGEMSWNDQKNYDGGDFERDPSSEDDMDGDGQNDHDGVDYERFLSSTSRNHNGEKNSKNNVHDSKSAKSDGVRSSARGSKEICMLFQRLCLGEKAQSEKKTEVEEIFLIRRRKSQHLGVTFLSNSTRSEGFSLLFQKILFQFSTN